MSTGLTTTSKERLRAWLKILKTARLIEKELRERFRTELDTTLPRFDVMAALARSDAGLKMNELSTELRVSNGNVTGIVDRLVDNGLVERRAVVGDRRAQLICLTSHGAATFADHANIHEGWVDELLADLPASDVEQLMDLLDLVITKEDLS
ncbi:MAG: MarR family transcriptional regulator [Acidimicrobiaceae bacterium]|nr:MarR family transcriptional regulator [Acidimicrobiaceae bacterium]MDB4205726.1 MarR family transcriptional regulator [bacterium]MDC1388381.1 MarR family transcriptional regulator [Acidimicrobiales bacterium]